MPRASISPSFTMIKHKCIKCVERESCHYYNKIVPRMKQPLVDCASFVKELSRGEVMVKIIQKQIKRLSK